MNLLEKIKSYRPIYFDIFCLILVISAIMLLFKFMFETKSEVFVFILALTALQFTLALLICYENIREFLRKKTVKNK